MVSIFEYIESLTIFVKSNEDDFDIPLEIPLFYLLKVTLMSKICEMKMQEEAKTYFLDVNEIKEATAEKESATYVEVLSFLRDIFKLVDFTGIINNNKNTIL